MRNTMSKIGNVIQSKWFLTIIVILLLSAKMMAQIPNSGFENWTTYGNGMIPDGWWSTNDSINSTSSYFPVTRSTDHYPASIGSYSIRLECNPSLSGWAKYGFALPGGEFRHNVYPVFPVTGHPKSLCGYYKYLPQNGDTMYIWYRLFKNGVTVTSGNFLCNTTVSDWTAFKIFVKDTSYSSADSAYIYVCAYYGSGIVHGNSMLYVDNLSFDDLITSVSKDQTDEIPSKYELSQNYPNPFNPSTVISYQVANLGEVSLKVFDLLGREIATLVNEVKAAGSYSKQWNAATMSSGIYFYRLQAGSYTQTKKLILLR